MNALKVGDLVRPSYQGNKGAVPAYDRMHGTVVQTYPDGSVRVDWFDGVLLHRLGADVMPRPASSVELVTP